jgi:quercetin dioxygenase-like cupin family protein
MRLADIPFGTTDWSGIVPERHSGDVGEATWRVQFFGPADNRVRVRMIEYSVGYEADHWCSKGHIMLCLDGALTTTLEDGRQFELTPGVSYQVADGAERHRSRAPRGAKLFAVD